MSLFKDIKLLSIVGLVGLFIACEPLTPQNSTQSKFLQYDNFSYEEKVGYARILTGTVDNLNELENPILILGQKDRLVLDFDLLVENAEFLNAKIFHCTKEWNKSRLQDLEFLDEINNFRINETNISLNTITPYINYRFQIPEPTISGNYIIVVYRRGNPNDIILSRRFMVAENISIIETLVKQSNTISKRRTNQQVEITVNYGKLQVNNPFEDLSISVIQNRNTNSIKKNIKPTLVRPNENYVEYRPIDLNLNFNGWKEYRFFDLRTIDVSGRNVRKTTKTTEGLMSILRQDQSRGTKPYSLDFRDINGRYLIGTNDIGRNFYSTEYSNVIFSLKSPEVEGNVFVTGRFSDWKLTEPYQLSYDRDTNSYIGEVLLKQGYYEYMYYVEADTVSPYYFEGSHFETENEYELLVYYRQPGTIHDQIIGYKRFGSIN